MKGNPGAIRKNLLPWLIKMGRTGSRHIYRCTEEEVAALEERLGVRFPEAYREFLLVMGHGAGDLLLGTDAFYGHLPHLREWANELLAEEQTGFRLPEDAFVFAMHQGYRFLYFRLSEGEDPPVRRGKLEEKGLTFTEYLLDDLVQTTVPLTDVALADSRGLRFKVTERHQRGKRWQEVRKDLSSLQSAFAVALEVSCEEAAVWVQCTDGNGSMMYWVSSSPRLFNSIVLKEGYS